MAHSANYLKNKAETNLSEQDSPKKEHHRNHRHHNNRSHPRKTQDDGSRNTRGRDHSKRNRDPERDAGREIHEEKRSRVRDAHNHGYRMREDEHRMEREYRKRENRDHLYKREREHHSQTYENTSHSKRQPNYRNEKEIPDNGQIYRHKNYIETVSPEYVVTEDKRSEMHYFKQEDSGEILNCYRCRYLCTNRGIVQMLEAMLNMLVLVCVVASYIILSGYSSNGGLATSFFSINSDYSPLEGEQLKEVQKLDREFIVMRAPELYAGIGVSIAMFAITLGIMIKDAQFLHNMSLKWLMFEVIFNILASLGYTAAVGVYLYFVLQINATDVCKRRELLYARYGLNWMNCDLSGSDAAAACFGILLAIFYCASAILAVQFYRKVRKQNKNTSHS
ncbi:MARVEL domain-containing protein 3-like isoform X2 [Pristis pectinata]|uniref:MARVEL domain-containing protein 3-like isoform X2 n=1 Tax=Pristis pectinata TaxID=685728 RepID=UPI00223E31D5|nr:MARVEL domain-containing protein 3-like isoform X2 [Pristis pectinata]